MRYIRLLITLLLSGTSVLADKNEEISKHPATQVTFSYLKNAMVQDWEKAANLIEPLSLENLKTRYILQIKASSTFDEEIAQIFGKSKS